MNITKKETILIASALIALFFTGVIAGYIWRSITIPVEVKEPLELTTYPTLISLNAGENETFAVSITDHATVNYLVTLSFRLNDTDYEATYVTYSSTSYIVIPGENTLEAWMKVSEDAPAPVSLELTVDFDRAAPA